MMSKDYNTVVDSPPNKYGYMTAKLSIYLYLSKYIQQRRSNFSSREVSFSVRQNEYAYKVRGAQVFDRKISITTQFFDQGLNLHVFSIAIEMLATKDSVQSSSSLKSRPIVVLIIRF